MGAPALALSALEVTVRGRGGAFAGAERVGVHSQAHRTARITPFGSELREDPVESFGFGLQADSGGTGDDEHSDGVGFLASLDNGRCGPQVLDAPVRARAEEDRVDADIAHRSTGLQIHVFQGPFGGETL